MASRRFEYKDAKSDKFWEIELEGKSFTVNYGRCGTSGQSKTKEYADEAKAKKEYDKIVAKKVKSGYVEVGGTTKPLPKTPKKETPKKVKKRKTKEKASTPQSAPKERTLGLSSAEWLVATWRKLSNKEIPLPSPFDREACGEKLKKLKLTGYGYDADWKRLAIPFSMTKEEAHFWYEAMMTFQPKMLGATLYEKVKDIDITGNVPFSRVKEDIEKNWRVAHTPLFKLVLVKLLDTKDLASLFSSPIGHSGAYRGAKGAKLQQGGFSKYILPLLSDADLNDFRESIRPHINVKSWPTDKYITPVPFHIAALIGMGEELLPVVESWPDDTYSGGDWRDHYHCPQQVIFGLNSPELVSLHIKRLSLRLKHPSHIKAWLAHTEYSDLPFVANSICKETNKDDAAKVMSAFCGVVAPEAAGPMLQCSIESKASAKALSWLNENLNETITGLLPIAASNSKYTEAAAERLQTVIRQGKEILISKALEDMDDNTKKLIDERVINAPGMNITAFTENNVPKWLQDELSNIPARAKLPKWLTAGDLPPVIVGEHCLNAEQMNSLLLILSKANPEDKLPIASSLKEYGDRTALAKFAWKLFDTWQGVGAPSKEKWAFLALGHLGDDSIVFKLTPLVRAWPGESLHARAVLGLKVIRAIGTDTALQELSGIAAKLKFKALKKQANFLMEEIAKDLGLTRDDLEDRVIPTCGLDERGNRVFDFGSRTFTFVLGPEMKPMVKDEKGKRKANLPKPGKNDDEAKAKEALTDWKLMKKQIRQICKIQATRLEQGMIKGRRWRTSDFKKLIANHPLMTHVAQSLLWAQFSEQGTLLTSFRVTEEQDFADSEDETVTLEDKAVVGLIHPLALPEQERATWGQVFADYEIIPPFPQLGRTVYRLEPGEEQKECIERFTNLSLPAPTLVFGLEKQGWTRGQAMDAGCFCEHSKIFDSAGVTVVILYEGTVGMQYIEATETLKVNEVYFVKGARSPSGYAYKEAKLQLKAIDEIVLSEVLHDLNLLASKAQ